MISAENDAVPVIMFHSVRPPDDPWFWDHLSVSPQLFEAFLQYLHSRGYRTVFVKDLIESKLKGRPWPKRSIALTFDDGYLDNWTIVHPLLKKYQFCATVFVSVDFVDPRPVVRKQIIDIQREKGNGDLWNGYLSWQEMKEAEASRILDIQSHAMNHTWYFTSGRIVDFYYPGAKYPWLAWNAFPDRKYMWLVEDQSHLVQFGTPVYEHEKSLIARRYFPPSDIEEALTSYVKHHGGEIFFTQKEWRNQLLAVAMGIKREGTYESDGAYQKRVAWELSRSKEEIEGKLCKKVDIICWPGGGYNEVTTKIALRCGYRAWTLKGQRNLPQDLPQHIYRISFPFLKRKILEHPINQLVYRYKLGSSLGEGGWPYLRLVISKFYPLWKRLLSPRPRR